MSDALLTRIAVALEKIAANGGGSVTAAAATGKAAAKAEKPEKAEKAAATGKGKGKPPMPEMPDSDMFGDEGEGDGLDDLLGGDDETEVEEEEEEVPEHKAVVEVFMKLKNAKGRDAASAVLKKFAKSLDAVTPEQRKEVIAAAEAAMKKK